MSRCLVCLIALGLLSLPLRAFSDSPAPWPFSVGETLWYRITLLGRPSGYMSSASRLIRGENGEELLEVAERQVVTVALGGEPMRLVDDLVTHYRRDLTPVRWELRLDKLGVIQQVSARREGDRLRVVTEEGGQRREQTLALPADFSSELAVFAAVAKGALKPGESRTLTAFIPQVSALDTETITVGEPETISVQGEAQHCYPLRVTMQQVGSEIRAWVNEKGEVVRYQLPALLNALVERVSEAEALAQLSPLVLANSIALDRPLPRAETLSEVTLHATGIGQDVAALVPVGPRQQVEPTGDGAAKIIVRRQEPPTRSVALPVTAADLAEYLRATPMAQSEDPQIQGLARQIVGEQQSAWPAAVALHNWVYRNLTKVESEPRPITALEVLQQKRGDCSEHALLLATLARAAGIPSRLIAGLAALGDKYFYHAWVEVWVGEWVEMDPTWNQTLVDAGHLRLAESAMDEVSFARMSLETGRTLGTLSLRVVDYEAEP